MLKAQTATMLVDGEGMIRMCSSAAAALFGTAPSDLEGLRLHEVLESPDRDALLEALQSARRWTDPSSPPSIRATIRRHGGRTVTIRMQVEPLGDAGRGNAARGLTLLVFQAGGAADSPPEAQNAPEVANAAYDAFAVIQAGIILEPSAGLGDLVGLSKESLSGWNVKNLAAAEDLLPLIEALRMVESGERSCVDFGFRLLRGGSLPPLEVAARARRIGRKGSSAVVLALNDVSESVRLVRRATRALVQLDAALTTVHDAVLLTGTAEENWPIRYASGSFKAMFGMEPSAWLGCPFPDIARRLEPLFVRSGPADPRWAGILTDPDEVRSDRLELAGRRGRFLERFVGPIKDAAGVVIGHLCAFRDVTAGAGEAAQAPGSGRRAGHETRQEYGPAEELRLANEGLERRLDRLARVNRELSDLDEMKSELLANVTHELQAPLVSIRGFTEMILGGHLGAINDEQQHGLEVALRNVDRLIGLIDDLLAFARGMGTISRPALEVFELEPLVDEAVTLLRPDAERRGIRIRSEGMAGRRVRGDRDQIAQVLLNLLGNAIKYNRDAGRVTIRAEPRGTDKVRVSIQDTGIGLTPEEQSRIFDRYYRSETVKRSRRGAGIGLAIVRDILRGHGSVIRVESEVGKGGTFSFVLPLVSRDEPAPGDHRRVRDRAARSRGGGQREAVR
ncbi:MAG: ATP-binding protein [Acidobacteriota bacterium]